MSSKCSEKLYKFLFPGFKCSLAIRLIVTVVVAGTVFSLFRPCVVSGSSMEPNWHDRQFTLSFRLRYVLFPLQHGDVVTISYFGKTLLLKRVVGLPGDKVEFKNGELLINGEKRFEPYVNYPCDWSTDPVVVREGHCFVVGDNRSQKIFEHVFGEVELKRITGGPLF